MQQGSDCKANRLARDLNRRLNQDLKKQRTKARNGKIRGESASWMRRMEMAFKWESNAVAKLKVCLGGAELEAQLEKAIDIMKDLDRMEKIQESMKAKLGNSSSRFRPEDYIKIKDNLNNKND